MKKIKCELCLTCLKSEYGQGSHPDADLVNMKTRGFLSHPNHHLYTIIKMFETSFEKHADSLNVFEDTYEDLLSNDNVILKWECSVHKSEILTEIYTMYIVMRMRQYSYMKNIESKQINKAKKKLSKLVPT